MHQKKTKGEMVYMDFQKGIWCNETAVLQGIKISQEP